MAKRRGETKRKEKETGKKQSNSTFHERASTDDYMYNYHWP